MRLITPSSLYTAFMLGALVSQPALAQYCSKNAINLTYPATQKVDHVDDYHGVKVSDPYRWLEDANSADTKTWVAAQTQLTQGFLNQIPEREAIKQRLTHLWNFERFSVPMKGGGQYFFQRNNGLQNQSVLYTMKQLKGEPRLLLDPNTLSSDGTVALAGLATSPNGRYLAYGTAASGSDWNEWKVRDVVSGKDLTDHLKWIKFSEPSWSKDNSGFYYERYDEPKESTKLADINYFPKVYFHKIGTPQSEDKFVYGNPDQKEWGFDAKETDDGRYLVITISKGTARKHRIYFKDLQAKDGKVVALLDTFDASYKFIDNVGPVFWFHTNKDAARGRVMTVDIRNGKQQAVVPETADTLRSAHLVDNKLVLNYMKDAHSQISLADLKGKLLKEIVLPGIGTAAGFNGTRNDKEVFYSYSDFTTPLSIYRYDMKTGKSNVFRQPKVDFDSTAYETNQVFFNSRDGTRVPMFIVSKKGINRDGSYPTYLYGYGGFDTSLTPSFSVPNLAFMEMGGVYVVANLRGGGEYGASWHEAGTKLKKQNVFDDFIGAAEWLIANKVTSPAKLSIGGGSNGGLLVGAAMTQRPELFAAAVPAVGVMDMLRFHKFTIGWAWASDYGSSEDEAQFKALYAYSPLHNIKADKCYPATLVMTGDHDDRVVPAHSYKFTATAQAAQATHGASAPILIRIDANAGHGAGKPVRKMIDEAADRWGFLVKTLDMSLPKTIASH